jgi:hypothetical protein
MATKLKTYDFGPQSKLTTGKKADYPWEDWFDGDIWQITMGDDFEGNPLMMERIIRSRAVSRDAKVKLRHVGIDENSNGMGVIVFQRTDIEGPETRKRRETNEKRQNTRAAKKSTAATVEPVQKKTKPVVPEADVTHVPEKANGTVTKRPARKLRAVS